MSLELPIFIEYIGQIQIMTCIGEILKVCLQTLINDSVSSSDCYICMATYNLSPI